METSPTKAVQTRATFHQSCAIACTIQASPDRIWSLLTRAEDIPRWNSTVTSISGPIALGKKLALKVPAAERTFTPRVTRFEEGKAMEWSDGMAPMFKGIRTFTLTPKADGATEFAMNEELSGLMLPIIKGSLPDFAPVFEAYAEDLKRAAEGGRRES